MSLIRTPRATVFGSRVVSLACLALLVSAVAGVAQTPGPAGRTDPATGRVPGKNFVDYFEPIPVQAPLSATVWGAATVGPRDTRNGLEDVTMTKWDYWDGKIIKGRDGLYHMLASRWDQSQGHDGWGGSRAVEAVSRTRLGPYVDQGLCWPDNEGGKGHNVTGTAMPDGRYAAVVSETRPGDVFAAGSLEGPWRQIGSIQVAPGPYSNLAWMSNVSVTARPDGGFEIIQRSGAILISRNGVLGPYTVQGANIYPGVAGLPQDNLGDLEDPVVWYSGGLYHIVVNNWMDRRAYHLTSADGIRGWTYRGVAYDPATDFVRYVNGAVNHWNKMERCGVLLENGHVTAVTLAVIDVPKEEEHGSDGHGSKIIVLPFDGAAMDRDLQKSMRASPTSAPAVGRTGGGPADGLTRQ